MKCYKSLNHVTRIYYILFQDINESFHSLLFFSRFDRIFFRRRKRYDYSKKKIKEKHQIERVRMC